MRHLNGSKTLTLLLKEYSTEIALSSSNTVNDPDEQFGKKEEIITAEPTHK